MYFSTILTQVQNKHFTQIVLFGNISYIDYMNCSGALVVILLPVQTKKLNIPENVHFGFY